MLVTSQQAVRRTSARCWRRPRRTPVWAAMAQSIARRLSVRRRPRDARAEHGTGALASVPLCLPQKVRIAAAMVAALSADLSGLGD